MIDKIVANVADNPTRKMIEAGAKVLREFDIGPNSSRHMAEWVYNAMRVAASAESAIPNNEED